MPLGLSIASNTVNCISTDSQGHKDIYLGGRQELRIVSPSEKWA